MSDHHNANQETANHQSAPKGWSWWYLLFVVQFVAVLWPPFYNSIEPRWIGIPFFYWYQLLWVIIAAVFTGLVYFATERAGNDRASDLDAHNSHRG
jgi:hypothetical protein